MNKKCRFFLTSELSSKKNRALVEQQKALIESSPTFATGLAYIVFINNYHVTHTWIMSLDDMGQIAATDPVKVATLAELTRSPSVMTAIITGPNNYDYVVIEPLGR